MLELMNQSEHITVSNITILGIAGAALTFLIKYFISSKDKNTEIIMKDIKEMKEFFLKISVDQASLNNHLGYSKTTLETALGEITKLRDTVHGQSRTIERLNSFRTTAEKHLADLEKKFNNLERKL